MAEMDRRIALLQLSVHDILQHHPAGISEYELLAALESQQQIGDEVGVYSSDLTIFQNHFLLFHTLYTLREALLSSTERADIEIHCLKIRLVPLSPNSSFLPQRQDSLRDYYLDMDNLKSTSEADVERLLNSFWQRYVASDAYLQALATLGLQGQVSYEEIKLQYRRLVMEHHPDRGGDNVLLQDINRAMRQLKLYHQQ